MRTTVTLDSDSEHLIRSFMSRRDLTFKQAVNEAIRIALGRRGRPGSIETPTVDLGSPLLPLERAEQLLDNAAG